MIGLLPSFFCSLIFALTDQSGLALAYSRGDGCYDNMAKIEKNEQREACEYSLTEFISHILRHGDKLLQQDATGVEKEFAADLSDSEPFGCVSAAIVQ